MAIITHWVAYVRSMPQECYARPVSLEALISKDISYVTEEYVPARLEEGGFLD